MKTKIMKGRTNSKISVHQISGDKKSKKEQKWKMKQKESIKNKKNN